MGIEDFLKDPSKIGVTVLLLSGIGALIRGLLIPSWIFNKVCGSYELQITKLTAERDYFQNRMFQALDIVTSTQQVRRGLFDHKDP